MSLTPKQRRFIDHYLESGNATEAAKRAGYSERSAAEVGYENLRKPQIAEEIKMRVQATAMSVEEAIGRLADFARGDLSAVFEFVDGVKQPYITITKENAKYIKKFKRDADGKIEVELEDRQSAIDKILKVAGAYINRTELTGKDGAPLQITTLEIVKEAADAGDADPDA